MALIASLIAYLIAFPIASTPLPKTVEWL